MTIATNDGHKLVPRLMDLELATLDDIIAELRRRRIWFVLAAVSPSNQTHSNQVVCAGQARSRRHLLPLVRQLRKLLSQEYDSDRGA